MRLFLSGGGSGEKSIELDKRFALAVGKEKPLLYIPIAIDKKRYPYPECLKWIKSTFNPLGIENIELWTEEDIRKKNDLQRFGSVYIGGGNTFYLLKELKDSGFLAKLVGLIKNNVAVYGGSAGAMMHSKSITTALSADPNDVKLKDFSAMNLVKDYDLWCHYEPNMDEEIKKYQEKYGMKIIALPEDCGLCVTDKNIEVVGSGSAFLFLKAIKEIKPRSYV
jgi:dipeptidase E